MRLWIKEHESLHESITNLVFFACLDPREGRKIVARAFKPWKMVIIKTQVPEGRLKTCQSSLRDFYFIWMFFQALKCLATDGSPRWGFCAHVFCQELIRN